MSAQDPARSKEQRKVFTSAQLSATVVAVILLTVFASGRFVLFYLLPQSSRPGRFSHQGQLGLDRKLAYLGMSRDDSGKDPRTAEPGPYREDGAHRFVEFSERELNGLITQNPQWGSRLAIDLADDLISFTALIPVPDGFPVMSGQKIRLTAGAEVKFRNDRPLLVLNGVSVMGVPLPGVWLGNLKNVDLIEEFGNDPGFWQSFAEGVADVEVREGRLRVELRE